MELSRRLKAVADLVSENKRVADIGCDHGYVSIYLASERKCKKVIAMDVNVGPLEHAKTNIEKFGLHKQIEARLSDGTKALKKDEVDTLLIAGMGGRLMNRILQDGFDSLGDFEELVLQPQSEVENVRAFLRKNNYQIVDENFVIEDGKNYPMIKAIKVPQVEIDEQFFSIELQDLFGPVLLNKRPEDFVTYLKLKKEKNSELLQRITQAEKKEDMLVLISQIDYVLTHIAE